MLPPMGLMGYSEYARTLTEEQLNEWIHVKEEDIRVSGRMHDHDSRMNAIKAARKQLQRLKSQPTQSPAAATKTGGAYWDNDPFEGMPEPDYLQGSKPMPGKSQFKGGTDTNKPKPLIEGVDLQQMQGKFGLHADLFQGMVKEYAGLGIASPSAQSLERYISGRVQYMAGAGNAQQFYQNPASIAPPQLQSTYSQMAQYGVTRKEVDDLLISRGVNPNDTGAVNALMQQEFGQWMSQPNYDENGRLIQRVQTRYAAPGKVARLEGRVAGVNDILDTDRPDVLYRGEGSVFTAKSFTDANFAPSGTQPNTIMSTRDVTNPNEAAKMVKQFQRNAPVYAQPNIVRGGRDVTVQTNALTSTVEQPLRGFVAPVALMLTDANIEGMSVQAVDDTLAVTRTTRAYDVEPGRSLNFVAPGTEWDLDKDENVVPFEGANPLRLKGGGKMKLLDVVAGTRERVAESGEKSIVPTYTAIFERSQTLPQIHAQEKSGYSKSVMGFYDQDYMDELYGADALEQQAAATGNPIFQQMADQAREIERSTGVAPGQYSYNYAKYMENLPGVYYMTHLQEVQQFLGKTDEEMQSWTWSQAGDENRALYEHFWKDLAPKFSRETRHRRDVHESNLGIYGQIEDPNLRQDLGNGMFRITTNPIQTMYVPDMLRMIREQGGGQSDLIPEDALAAIRRTMPELAAEYEAAGTRERTRAQDIRQAALANTGQYAPAPGRQLVTPELAQDVYETASLMAMSETSYTTPEEIPDVVMANYMTQAAAKQREWSGTQLEWPTGLISPSPETIKQLTTGGATEEEEFSRMASLQMRMFQAVAKGDQEQVAKLSGSFKEEIEAISASPMVEKALSGTHTAGQSKYNVLGGAEDIPSNQIVIPDEQVLEALGLGRDASQEQREAALAADIPILYDRAPMSGDDRYDETAFFQGISYSRYRREGGKSLNAAKMQMSSVAMEATGSDPDGDYARGMIAAGLVRYDDKTGQYQVKFPEGWRFATKEEVAADARKLQHENLRPSLARENENPQERIEKASMGNMRELGPEGLNLAARTNAEMKKILGADYNVLKLLEGVSAASEQDEAARKLFGAVYGLEQTPKVLSEQGRRMMDVMGAATIKGSKNRMPGEEGEFGRFFMQGGVGAAYERVLDAAIQAKEVTPEAATLFMPKEMHEWAIDEGIPRVRAAQKIYSRTGDKKDKAAMLRAIAAVKGKAKELGGGDWTATAMQTPGGITLGGIMLAGERRRGRASAANLGVTEEQYGLLSDVADLSQMLKKEQSKNAEGEYERNPSDVQQQHIERGREIAGERGFETRLSRSMAEPAFPQEAVDPLVDKLVGGIAAEPSLEQLQRRLESGNDKDYYSAVNDALSLGYEIHDGKVWRSGEYQQSLGVQPKAESASPVQPTSTVETKPSPVIASQLPPTTGSQLAKFQQRQAKTAALQGKTAPAPQTAAPAPTTPPVQTTPPPPASSPTPTSTTPPSAPNPPTATTPTDPFAAVRQRVLKGFGSFGEMVQASHGNFVKGKGQRPLRQLYNERMKAGDLAGAQEVVDYARSEGLEVTPTASGDLRFMYSQYMQAHGMTPPRTKPAAAGSGKGAQQPPNDNVAVAPDTDLPDDVSGDANSLLSDYDKFLRGDTIYEKVERWDEEKQVMGSYTRAVNLNINPEDVERFKADFGIQGLDVSESPVLAELQDVVGMAQAGYDPTSREDTAFAGRADNAIKSMNSIARQAFSAEARATRYQQRGKELESQMLERANAIEQAGDTQGADKLRQDAAAFGKELEARAQQSSPVQRSSEVAAVGEGMQALGIARKRGALGEVADQMRTLRRKAQYTETKTARTAREKQERQQRFGATLDEVISGNLQFDNRTQALAYAQQNDLGGFGGVLADLSEGKRLSDADIEKVIGAAPHLQGLVEDYQVTSSQKQGMDIAAGRQLFEQLATGSGNLAMDTLFSQAKKAGIKGGALSALETMAKGEQLSGAQGRALFQTLGVKPSTVEQWNQDNAKAEIGAISSEGEVRALEASFGEMSHQEIAKAKQQISQFYSRGGEVGIPGGRGRVEARNEGLIPPPLPNQTVPPIPGMDFGRIDTDEQLKQLKSAMPNMNRKDLARANSEIAKYYGRQMLNPQQPRGAGERSVEHVPADIGRVRSQQEADALAENIPNMTRFEQIKAQSELSRFYGQGGEQRPEERGRVDVQYVDRKAEQEGADVGFMRRMLMGGFNDEDQMVAMGQQAGLGKNMFNLAGKLQAGGKLTRNERIKFIQMGLGQEARAYGSRLGDEELNWLSRGGAEQFGISGQFASQDEVEAAIRGSGVTDEDEITAIRERIVGETAIAGVGGRERIEKLQSTAHGIVQEMRRVKGNEAGSWRDATSRKQLLTRKMGQLNKLQQQMGRISDETGMDFGLSQEDREYVAQAQRAQGIQAGTVKEIMNNPLRGGFLGVGKGTFSGQDTLQNELVELTKGMHGELKEIRKHTRGMDDSTKKLAERETMRTGLREFDRIVGEAREIGGEAGVAKLLGSKQAREFLRTTEGEEGPATKVGLAFRKLMSPLSSEGAMMRAFWRMGVGDVEAGSGQLASMGMRDLAQSGLGALGAALGATRAPGLSAPSRQGLGDIVSDLGPSGEALVRLNRQAANRRTAAEIGEQAWGWTQGDGGMDKFKALTSPALSFGMGAGTIAKMLGLGQYAGLIGGAVGLGAMGIGAFQYSYNSAKDTVYNQFTALREQQTMNDPNAKLTDKLWAYTSAGLRNFQSTGLGNSLAMIFGGKLNEYTYPGEDSTVERNRMATRAGGTGNSPSMSGVANYGTPSQQGEGVRPISATSPGPREGQTSKERPEMGRPGDESEPGNLTVTSSKDGKREWSKEFALGGSADEINSMSRLERIRRGVYYIGVEGAARLMNVNNLPNMIAGKLGIIPEFLRKKETTGQNINEAVHDFGGFVGRTVNIAKNVAILNADMGFDRDEIAEMRVRYGMMRYDIDHGGDKKQLRREALSDLGGMAFRYSGLAGVAAVGAGLYNALTPEKPYTGPTTGTFSPTAIAQYNQNAAVSGTFSQTALAAYADQRVAKPTSGTFSPTAIAQYANLANQYQAQPGETAREFYENTLRDQYGLEIIDRGTDEEKERYFQGYLESLDSPANDKEAREQRKETDRLRKDLGISKDKASELTDLAKKGKLSALDVQAVLDKYEDFTKSGISAEFVDQAKELMSKSVWQLKPVERMQAMAMTGRSLGLKDLNWQLISEEDRTNAVRQYAAMTGNDTNAIVDENGKITNQSAASMIMGSLTGAFNWNQVESLTQATRGGTAGRYRMAQWLQGYKMLHPGTREGSIETAIGQYAGFSQYGWSQDEILKQAGKAGESTGMAAVNLQKFMGMDQRFISQAIQGRQFEMNDQGLLQALSGQYQLQTQDQLGAAIGTYGGLGNLIKGTNMSVNATKFYDALSTTMYKPAMDILRTGGSLQDVISQTASGTLLEGWKGDSLQSLGDYMQSAQLAVQDKQVGWQKQQYRTRYGRDLSVPQFRSIEDIQNWQSEGYQSLDEIGGTFQEQRQQELRRRQMQVASTEGGTVTTAQGGIYTFTGQFAFQDRQRETQEQRWGEDYKRQDEQMKQQRAFQLAEQGWQWDDANTQRDQALIQRGWQDADMKQEYARGNIRFDWQEEDLKKQKDRMQSGKDYQLWNLNWQQQMTQLQRGWQQEDFATARSTNQLQFGWQMEDVDENIRFASGRQRKQLLKQKERATISQAITEKGMDTQEERAEITNKMQDEKFEKEKAHLLENLEIQESDWQTQFDRLAQQRTWHDEDYQKQVDRWTTQTQWQDSEWEKWLSRWDVRVGYADKQYADEVALYELSGRRHAEDKAFEEERIAEERKQWEVEKAFYEDEKKTKDAIALDEANITKAQTELQLAMQASTNAVSAMTSMLQILQGLQQSGAIDNFEAMLAQLGQSSTVDTNYYNRIPNYGSPLLGSPR